MNAYSNDYGICLAQKIIDGKTNEIPAAQELLGLMDLRDASGKRDYVLAPKGNQRLLYEEVRAYLEESLLEELKGKEGCYKKTVEPERGGSAVL